MLVVHSPQKSSEAGGKHMNDAALKINRKKMKVSTNHRSKIIISIYA